MHRVRRLALLQLLERLERLGHDAELVRCELLAAGLLDATDPIPYSSLVAAKEIAGRLAGPKVDLGLELARVTFPGDFGARADAVLGEHPTVEQALRTVPLGMHTWEHGPQASVHLTSEGDGVFVYTLPGGLPPAGARIDGTQTLLMTPIIFDRLCDTPGRWLVSLPYRPPDLTGFRRALPGAVFVCDAPAWSLGVPRSLLARRLGGPPRSRVAIRDVLAHEALPALDDTFASRVAEAVTALLPARPSAAAVGGRLHMSARTLQRRLQDDGTTLQAVVDDVLLDRACLLLRTTELPAASISALLGYANPTAFHRAFTRWSGAPPGQWRQQATA